jgi:hypothetical protein
VFLNTFRDSNESLVFLNTFRDSDESLAFLNTFRYSNESLVSGKSALILIDPRLF